MLNKIILLALSATSAQAAFAAHIVTDTRDGDTLVQRTHTYANRAGDLRTDDYGFTYSSTMSDNADATTSNQSVEVSNKIDDTVLYQSKDQAIVSLEGNICRRLTADSAPPPGLGGVNMGDMQKQMADAMKQAGSAMEEAMKKARKDGMSAEQEQAMRQFTQPLIEMKSAKPKDSLHIQKLNETITVLGIKSKGYSIVDETGQEKHRIWVAPVSKVPGGKQIRRGYEGMINTYLKYLDTFGGAALLDTALSPMFTKPELAETYPMRIDDMESGEITEVVEFASNDDSVEFYPECEERGLMGY